MLDIQEQGKISSLNYLAEAAWIETAHPSFVALVKYNSSCVLKEKYNYGLMPMFDSTKQFPMGMERLKTHPSMKGLYIYLIHLTGILDRSLFRGFKIYIALH